MGRARDFEIYRAMIKYVFNGIHLYLLLHRGKTLKSFKETMSPSIDTSGSHYTQVQTSSNSDRWHTECLSLLQLCHHSASSGRQLQFLRHPLKERVYHLWRDLHQKPHFSLLQHAKAKPGCCQSLYALTLANLSLHG